MKSKTTSSTASTEKTKKLKKELENDDEYDYIAIPPDGGYGWVVLIACFIINMIVDGFLYAFGAISKDLQVHFRAHEWEVSLVISLACGCYLLSAPLASALCNKYGCRPIGIIGSFIAAGAVGASVFSPNIRVMWALFGFIGGIGMGLIYLPSIVMVGHYFEKKRAIATGITVSGTGIGSITFGPLSRSNEKEMDGAEVFGFQPTSPLLHDNEKTNSNASLDKSGKRARKDSSVSVRSRQSIKADDAARALYKEDVLYQADIQALPEYQSQPDIPTYVQNTTVVPDEPPNRKPSPMKAFWDVFLKMTNVHVLKDSKMLIICLANVCSMIGYYTPYLFTTKLAIQLGVSEYRAVLLISIIGFFNTGSRFVSGWITKLPKMSPLMVNNIGLVIAGIATLLVPLCTTYPLLVIYCAVWGTFIAFHVSLSPVIVCQLVGLELYSSALGLTLMFRGITSLTAPPVMGAIRDQTNSFNIAFIIGGLAFILSAIMHFSLYFIDKRRKDEPQQQNKPVNV
ncbi:unnamed protein product [Didymodactylos carnosus]|uniref:Monocarboxylate transporter n=1 Tax=Didymodactylos carnosus TaxID=1234261 RepID=A0A813QM77_9BILA|nr:unnamed protein product [Didymodactylos carnosus]CAF0769826.1 unnamed protein product [Didymodactylos carnosus]CAF3526311.1 unnamed protein product [Didymodactylos carnosus]CAF3551854.1 unnamed protein product [Didymodactylos carnosus]